jgi:hypothetical protein
VDVHASLRESAKLQAQIPICFSHKFVDRQPARRLAQQLQRLPAARNRAAVKNRPRKMEVGLEQAKKLTLEIQSEGGRRHERYREREAFQSRLLEAALLADELRTVAAGWTELCTKYIRKIYELGFTIVDFRKTPGRPSDVTSAAVRRMKPYDPAPPGRPRAAS